MGGRGYFLAFAVTKYELRVFIHRLALLPRHLLPNNSLKYSCTWREHGLPLSDANGGNLATHVAKLSQLGAHMGTLLWRGRNHYLLTYSWLIMATHCCADHSVYYSAGAHGESGCRGFTDHRGNRCNRLPDQTGQLRLRVSVDRRRFGGNL